MVADIVSGIQSSGDNLPTSKYAIVDRLLHIYDRCMDTGNGLSIAILGTMLKAYIISADKNGDIDWSVGDVNKEGAYLEKGTRIRQTRLSNKLYLDNQTGTLTDEYYTSKRFRAGKLPESTFDVQFAPDEVVKRHSKKTHLLKRR